MSNIQERLNNMTPEEITEYKETLFRKFDEYFRNSPELIPTLQSNIKAVLDETRKAKYFLRADWSLEEKLAYIMEQYEGGIFKRIGENREVLMAIQEKAPELEPFVFCWIDSTELFLNALAELVPL